MEETRQRESPVPVLRSRELTLRQKLKLVHGKVHRFYVGHFQKSFVTRNLARRKGECKRCGACCQLLFRCAFALECKEGIGCRIYKKRPVNCRVFPLTPRDLAERDIVMPDRRCGYYFENAKPHKKSRSK